MWLDAHQTEAVDRKTRLTWKYIFNPKCLSAFVGTGVAFAPLHSAPTCNEANARLSHVAPPNPQPQPPRTMFFNTHLSAIPRRNVMFPTQHFSDFSDAWMWMVRGETS